MPIDAGRQVAQLRHVLCLVEGLCGGEGASPHGDAALDEAARITATYHGAEPIVQRRFGILAAEVAAWSAAGVEALLAAGESRSPAAARQLAAELKSGLIELGSLLQPVAAAATPSP